MNTVFLMEEFIMSGFFIEIVRFFASILLSLGLLVSPFAQYTTVENREYHDGELTVEPEEGKFLSLTAVDEGWDIYNPYEGDDFGYRYGPSMIMNADGSIDAYFSTPGTHDEWDWITYRHSPDGGKTWTEEVSVLEPTADSPDFYSCCDPGIVKAGDYYYLAYTSTIQHEGLDNNVFVARSKNPDGPFEKWNGNGWGGARPVPIIEYTGDPTTYGAGEPSMVVLDGKLYLYYTWRDGPVNQTRVSVADATNENWPATLQYKGIGMTHRDGAFDSADVKYVEDYGKFIAVVTFERFTTESCVGVYVSDDGLTFLESYVTKTNISHCCHNCGITGRANGHIRLSDDIYLAYGYGDKWAYWPTRLNKVEIGLIDAPDFSDHLNDNVKTPVTFQPKSWYVNYIGIVPEKRCYELKTGETINLRIYKADTSLVTKRLYKDVTFSGFDESIITANGTKITAVSVGETFVTAEWNGHTSEIIVKVTE